MSSFIKEVSSDHHTLVRQGLVLLDHHPHFQAVSEQLSQQGVTLVLKKESSPSVQKERRVYQDNETKDSFTLSIAATALYMDLEYGLEHVEQIMERFLALGLPFYTDVWQENEHGQWKKDTSYEGLLHNWQNTIAEYHARLQEIKRLHERGVHYTVISDHSETLKIVTSKYLRATKLGKSETRKAWEEQFFPDLTALRVEVEQLLAVDSSDRASTVKVKNG